MQWYVFWDIGGNWEDRRRDWHSGVHADSETPRVKVSLSGLNTQWTTDLPVYGLDGHLSSLPSAA